MTKSMSVKCIVLQKGLNRIAAPLRTNQMYTLGPIFKEYEYFSNTATIYHRFPSCLSEANSFSFVTRLLFSLIQGRCNQK